MSLPFGPLNFHTGTANVGRGNVIALKPPHFGNSVELFSGCGGLAMGLSLAGFSHQLLVERDPHSNVTLSENKRLGTPHVRDWPVVKDDVRQVDWSPFAGCIRIVAGGPPCQPFSVGGKANGKNDQRDMWPEAVRAVRETLPDAFLFENVRGLLRPAFSEYVEWIAACLANPVLKKSDDETHRQHLAKLRRASQPALYQVRIFPVNAADYGAPQKRQRVLVVGLRKGLGPLPHLPPPTHSQASLVWEKWVTGAYWTRHGLPRPPETAMPFQEARVLRLLNSSPVPPSEKPWVTCRDAFLGLGEPSLRHDVPNHKFQPGARAYPGHTGSCIDEPAKALKAGVHGVPGGENMLARDDGSVRYFSIREAARLQGFDDKYVFPGSWSESMRQLGNAVPVQLSSFVAKWLATLLPSARLKQAA